MYRYNHLVHSIIGHFSLQYIGFSSFRDKNDWTGWDQTSTEVIFLLCPGSLSTEV